MFIYSKGLEVKDGKRAQSANFGVRLLKKYAYFLRVFLVNKNYS